MPDAPEMDLDEYPELMTELQYRRFFIYPSGEKIIVKRKKEVRIAIANIGEG